MARNRSVDFLPEVFKTDTNKEFLASTLDQLVQEPKLKQIQGYIGNKFKSGVNKGDTYLLEPTVERSNYQLETGVVFTNDNNDAEEVITYPEIIDALKTKGAIVDKHDRLFSSEAYCLSPFFDFDKFINHSQYYWMPNGPDTVDVQATEIDFEDNYNVTINDDYFSFDEVTGENPTLTLVRGGEYNFNISTQGVFYIQTEPGTSGVKASTPNISSRDVYGVSDNGTGVVNFAVPESNRQEFYHNLTEINDVDLVTMAKFNSINGKELSDVKNIDGITDLDGKTIVFLDTTNGDSESTGWIIEHDLFDETPTTMKFMAEQLTLIQLRIDTVFIKYNM